MSDDEILLLAEQVLVEITGNWELRAASFKSFETDAQVRHDPIGSSMAGCPNPHPVAPRVG
jgi:hypothetical protein